MDPILNEIVASVQKLLEEIHELQVGKDGLEMANPAKAAYLQGQIFRTFAVIDTLLGPCSDSEAILEMRKDVLLKKKELNAEAKDLKMMAIPKLLTTKVLEEWKEDGKDKMEEPFAYLNLPPEVRQIILNYLTCPSDKLNLVKALPGDGEMMEWSLDSLRWELVLLLVFKGNYGLTYADTVNLCRARPDLHAAVRNCFERNLLHVPVIDQMTTVVGGGHQHLNDIIASDLALNPLPVTAHLLLQLDQPDSESMTEQLHSLRQVGANIWSLSLQVEFQNAVSTQDALQVIRDFLALTPNLKNLIFRFLHDGQFEDNKDAEAVQDIRLPHLSQLHTMRFLGNGCEKIQTKLIEKYRPVIKHFLLLSTRHLLNLPLSEPGYSQLTFLIVMSNDSQESIVDAVLPLETFLGAPLHSICIFLCHSVNNVDNFRTILCFLNRFSDTLKQVVVRFSCSEIRHVGLNDLGWLASINFPKVRTLNLMAHPLTWTVLLHFPVIEELALSEDLKHDNPDESRYFDSSDILELSLNQEEMWTSNVWKLLPFLKTIRISGRNKQPFQVTRSQCHVLQRRLAKVMQALGPVYSTVTGSFQSIVHSDDNGQIFNGNVNGIVIQEGNGSILVNGTVEGNIEQKGDGKIFIRGKHTGEVFQTGNGTVEVDWGNVNK